VCGVLIEQDEAAIGFEDDVETSDHTDDPERYGEEGGLGTACQGGVGSGSDRMGRGGRGTEQGGGEGELGGGRRGVDRGGEMELGRRDGGGGGGGWERGRVGEGSG